MITVEDMYEYAIQTDLSHLAHSIHWALLNGAGLAKPHDDSETLKALPFDLKEIGDMKARNDLGIGKIRLFAIETKERDCFAFYFAESAQQAESVHSSLFRGSFTAVKDADRLMPNLMTLAETGEELSFYELRERTMLFPAFVGRVWFIGEGGSFWKAEKNQRMRFFSDLQVYFLGGKIADCNYCFKKPLLLPPLPFQSIHPTFR